MTDTYEEFKNGLKGRPNFYWAIFWWVLFLCFSLFVFLQCRYWVSIENGVWEYRSLEGRLEDLARNFQDYHAEHGSFPRDIFTHEDEEGKILLTWRGLISPRSYESHLAFLGYDSHIRMFAIVGPQTVWPPNASISKEQITDGPENTIHLIEYPDSVVEPSEIVDIRFDGTNLTLRGEPIDWPQGVHVGYPCWFWQSPVPFTYVTFADGSIERVPVNVPHEMLLAALTTSGGEPNLLRSYLTEHPVSVCGGPNAVLLIGFPFLTAAMLVMAFCHTYPLEGLRFTLFCCLGVAFFLYTGFFGVMTSGVQGYQSFSGSFEFSLFWIVFGLSGGGCIYMFNRARHYARWVNHHDSRPDGHRSQLEDSL